MGDFKMASACDEGAKIEYVEEENYRDKNENIQIPFLPELAEEWPKKRKRFPFRPYASPTTRIVNKCGKYNVISLNIPEKRTRYLKDFGNTLLTIRWRWILFSICVANIGTYLIYTALWMITVMWEESYMSEPETTPCVIGSSSFAGYFILVVTTITTIGGGTYPADCQSGWVLLTFQMTTGVIIQGILVSAIYAKMSRASEKQCSRMFTKKAVICRRDDVNCLIFRVQDVCGKYWAKTTIKAMLIQRKCTVGGETFPYYFHKLELDEVGLLIWPQEIVHRITEDSPLWTMSIFDLYRERFEIMVVLEGDSLTSGGHSQCQISYTNKEILWGYCFSPCIEYNETAQKYVVNKKMFNDVIKQEVAPEVQSLLNENGVN